MNFTDSIKFRFNLWYLAILLILLLLLGSGVFLAFSRIPNGHLDISIKTRFTKVSQFRDIIAIIGGGVFEEETGESISFFYHSDGQLKHISLRDERILLDANIIEKAISGVDSFTVMETPRGELFRVYVGHFRPNSPEIDLDMFKRPRPNGRKTIIHDAALAIARPLGHIELALKELLSILTFMIPLTLVISGIGGVFLAGRALKPVGKIINTARKIEETDLSQRIDIAAKDELGMLAETLNLMIERLENAFERQKQFTGDASHELRAPLAVLHAEATLALQKDRPAQSYKNSIEVIAQEVGHMTILIDQLLSLARADSGKETLIFEKTDLSGLIESLCADAELLCWEKEIKLTLDISDGVVIHGNQSGLRQLTHNLLSNAIRYTNEGGSITIALHKNSNQAILSFSDTGIGIPSEEVPHIFGRFYRVDKARSRQAGGSGLGLSICKRIVEIHKGQLKVESQVGAGSIFWVILPAG